MRLVGGGVLTVRAIAALNGTLPLGPAPTLFVQIALGLLLLVGLWTPVAGALVAVLQVWRLVEQQGDPFIHILLATLGGALALLGPGAWSIDARLFGWKRLDIRPEPFKPPTC